MLQMVVLPVPSGSSPQLCWCLLDLQVTCRTPQQLPSMLDFSMPEWRGGCVAPREGMCEQEVFILELVRWCGVVWVSLLFLCWLQEVDVVVGGTAGSPHRLTRTSIYSLTTSSVEAGWLRTSCCHNQYISILCYLQYLNERFFQMFSQHLNEAALIRFISQELLETTGSVLSSNIISAEVFTFEHQALSELSMPRWFASLGYPSNTTITVDP